MIVQAGQLLEANWVVDGAGDRGGQFAEVRRVSMVEAVTLDPDDAVDGGLERLRG
jgi:hypothetical protein